MLLNELIQVNHTQQNIDKHDHDAMKKSFLQDLTKRRGTNIGGFGKYDKSSNEPKMGVKQSHTASKSEEHDAYYTYIKAISQGDVASSNPYFPRVYSINTVKDKAGTITYKIDIEHLKPLRDLTSPELFVLWSRMFDKDKFQEHHIFSDKVDIDGAAKMVRDAAYGKIQPKDEQLHDALELIRYLMNKSDYNNDINKNNIMVRRTNLGYQLVITDPLS